MDSSAGFMPKVLLKKDVFSLVERGIFCNEPCVRRTIEHSPWYAYLLAKFLLHLEAKSLSHINTGRLLHKDKRSLIRSWVDGLPLHLAKPFNDKNYFSSAFFALRELHKKKICHNDLAKEQNWLKSKSGHAILIDFQLALVFKKRNLIFRTLAYEDLRHYLKHKKRYLPEKLTSIERKILSRKTMASQCYSLLFKKAYNFLTRGIFKMMDREGEGSRFHKEAPQMIQFLKTKDIEAHIFPYPDRNKGTGLYLFTTSNQDIPNLLKKRFKHPEYIQQISQFPKNLTNLKLIAMNQIDSIIMDEEKELINEIILHRKNLTDRISF